jgi:hypothetical protein
MMVVGARKTFQVVVVDEKPETALYRLASANAA